MFRKENVTLRPSSLSRAKLASPLTASLLIPLTLVFPTTTAAQQPSAVIAAPSGSTQTAHAKQEAPPKKLTVGSIEVSGNWRVRAEGWY